MRGVNVWKSALPLLRRLGPLPAWPFSKERSFIDRGLEALRG
jgi:hypothetical protein